MIWIVGSKGLLGSEVERALRERRANIVVTGREVDIAHAESVERFTAGRNIDWIVNCAGYTAVERAEVEPEACHRLNVEGPANLARWAEAHGAALLHMSTDYVFAGNGNAPYREDDKTEPRSVYGRTKAEGEVAVRDLCARHLILRTAWLYGTAAPNFVYTMLRLMRTKSSLGVVNDQQGAPTWAADLAAMIPSILAHAEGRWGTYHASGEGQCTWYGFAKAILEEGSRRGLIVASPVLTPLTTAEYPTKAQRPAWSVLSKDKLKAAFGLEFPHWRDSLRAFLDSPLDERRFS